MPCLLISFLLSWFFYSGKQDWPTATKTLLIFLRGLGLFLILALLLNPLIRKFKENVLPPISIFLIDDSQSISLGTAADSLKLLSSKIKSLKNEWEKSGSKVYVSGLRGDLNIDSLVFDKKESALSKRLNELKEEFDNQNVSQIILVSDGISNQGLDLSQIKQNIPIHTVRLGNPQPRKDLLISEIRMNKIAFKGNTFPVSVLVKGKKLEGNPISVSVWENGKNLDQKSGMLGSNGLFKTEFNLKAETKGIHGYQVKVDAIPGEITLANNTRNTFIEVIEGKQKILLAAAAPHPDLKAIKSALAGLGQMELEVVVGGLDSWKPENYNLVILHQLPDRAGTFGNQVSQVLKGNTPVLLITGAMTDLSKLKIEASSWLNIQGFGFSMEEISTEFQPDFQRFQFEEAWKKTLSGLSPVKSISSYYGFKAGAEAILIKKLGKATSPTPLLAVQVNDTPKRGIFWGEGLWIWRLNEYAQNENFNATDNLIQKTVQLLASTEKKQKLKISLPRNELSEGESAQFFAETFNQIFEPIFNQKIELLLRNKEGKKWNYTFYNNAEGTGFSSESLPPGTYSYLASAMLNGKKETDQGEFLVRPVELEALELEANHAGLQELSSNNEGISVGISGIDQLAPLGENNLKPMISFTDWDENVLSFWWILAFIGILFSTEWLLRKLYRGL